MPRRGLEDAWVAFDSGYAVGGDVGGHEGALAARTGREGNGQVVEASIERDGR